VNEWTWDRVIEALHLGVGVYVSIANDPRAQEAMKRGFGRKP
jgi:hypothetical protein